MRVPRLKNSFQLSSAYNQDEGFTSPHSDVFVNRYGRIHDLSQAENAYAEERAGAFCVAIAHGHLLLNCPPWATNWAEISGGGIKTGETIEEAAVRELREETGVEITAENLKQLTQNTTEYYMNLYSEDVENKPGKTPWLRYTQTFLFFDMSSLIAPETLNQARIGEGGSYGLWQPIDRVTDLPARIDTGEEISGLRVGHEHIIHKAVRQYFNNPQPHPTYVPSTASI